MYFGGSLLATLTVATCFFHTGASIYTSYWMSRWVESTDDSGSSTSYFLMRYIGLSYLTEAIDGVRMMAFSIGISVAANKLHMDMINAVMAAPLSWFSQQAISTVLNSLSGDMSTLDESIYHSIVPVISNIINCMLMTGAVASRLPIFILPALALLVFGCLIARMHAGVSHLLTELVSSSRSPVLSAFSEGLTGSMVIRATSSTPAIFHAKMTRLLCASSRAQHAQSNASQWLKFRMSILATAINVLAASLVLSQSGRMSAGFAGFCLSQATQLSDRILALIFSLNSLSVVMQTVRLAEDWASCCHLLIPSDVQFQRVREYAQLAPEKDGAIMSSEYVPADWPKTGAVELRNVTVRYSADGPDILKNISLTIQPGERVAIVGRTGSGKSTVSTDRQNNVFHVANLAIADILPPRVCKCRIWPNTSRRRGSASDPVQASATMHFHDSTRATTFPRNSRFQPRPFRNDPKIRTPGRLGRVPAHSPISRRGGGDSNRPR